MSLSAHVGRVKLGREGGRLADGARKKPGRGYRPKVESLEALRLLDAAAATLHPLVVERSAWSGGDQPAPRAEPLAASDHSTWDAALDQSRIAALLARSGEPSVAGESVHKGLNQLDRYLSRAWARSGIPSQQHEDCTQAVYARLLEELGSDNFETLAGQVGQRGVRPVLNRETTLGLDFFRAVDMVKKRTLRQRTLAALDHEGELPARVGTDGAAENRRGALQDAITRALNPREAALIRATLKGFSPAEIASHWGVAPKTVSNVKTRAFNKLRDALIVELAD